MESKLIKRYLLERGYLTGDIYRYKGTTDALYEDFMFNRYLNGEIEISQLEFDIWLKHFDQSNLYFGRILKQIGYIDENDDVLEVALSLNHNISSGLIMKTAKEIVLDDERRIKNSDQATKHLIMNGIYRNGIRHMANFFQKGCFSVGFCGEEGKFASKKVQQYRRIKELLIEKGITGIEEIDEKIFGNQRFYVLNLGCHPKLKECHEAKERYISQK